ncbi:bifunctional 5,10-methylenetetrahydrofolate dehydrogenase/5,10-methenyltetrahydrofolate cyclohydrolase [Fundicoccus sp. Sow4_D5]|uniref:bifunctional 5,10-methylenetetrahydrofolate dehydrogenase/5,10-methenyltetrahydrofolate cyclohydrolase n=1 Tax=unclassified Fundicoccus TaxID=2761543 RepID=UPI003F8FC5B6
MTTIIDGKLRSKELTTEYKTVVAKLAKVNVVPKLVVVTVGEDEASKVYVGQKQRKAIQIGMEFDWITLPEDITQATLSEQIEKLNNDDAVSGMIVQFPLPKHLSEKKVKEEILPSKDVDGFHPYNVGKLVGNDATVVACTPKGIINLLEHYQINPEGKNITIVGRSQIVGLPLSLLLTHLNGTVTVCHTRTADLKAHTRNADIVISAVGRAGTITADHLKEGAVVIDVGINRLPNGKLSGDVNYDEVFDKVSAITPVPGGVGPMTVAMLMEQTILCACLQHNLNPAEYLGRD